MGFLNKYKTDKNAEVNGVWIEVDDGVEWLIARLNNERAREMRRKLEKPYRSFQSIPDKVSEEILRKVIASTVLLDWKGMTDDNGKAIPYSAEKAEELLKDLPDLLTDVANASMARETFQTEAVEAAKNA
jgi:hypothetical protein